MENVENGVAPAATDSIAAPEHQSIAEALEAEDKAWNDDLTKVWDKHHKPRDEQGRFAGTQEPSGAEEAAAGPVTEEPAQTDQSPAAGQEEPSGEAAIPAPQSWSADMKAKWAALPPDVQEYVNKRDGEAHRQISEMGEKVKAFEPLRPHIETLREMTGRRGISEADGMQRLLAAQKFLDQNPTEAIRWLADAYKVDLGRFAKPATTGDEASDTDQVSALKSHIATLERQIAETSNRVTTREKADAEARMADLNSRIEKFASSKDDWADLEDDVFAQIHAVKAANPSASPEEILEKAYENALWANPEARARKLEADRKAEAERKAKEDKEKAEKAKKADGVNVRGDVVSGATPTTMDEDLTSIAAKHYGRKG